MKAFRSNHNPLYSIYPLLFIALSVIMSTLFCIPVSCQFLIPQFSSYGLFGLSSLGIFNPFSYPLIIPQPLAGNTSWQIQISKEFNPGQFTHENISFFINTDKPVSITVYIVSKNGQMILLELVPEDDDSGYQFQADRIIIPVGNDMTDGKWHEWELISMGNLLSGIGQEPSFIARIDIKGKSLCLGRIAAFSEDENGEKETSYLASFTDERDTIQEYGWSSAAPVKCEYVHPSGEESEEIMEGYVCLTPGQATQQTPSIKLPFTFISPPQGGLGPLLPVTIFAQTPPYEPFSSSYISLMAARMITSQLYSTPINPNLSLNLMQSLPLYLNAQTGVPYSVKQNIFQGNGSLPQYATGIDYRNDPAYAYLMLIDPVYTPGIEFY
ncbi:hypothetical protein JXL19_12650 [bacterium]|nr:hypothetical protein [bacterium]